MHPATASTGAPLTPAAPTLLGAGPDPAGAATLPRALIRACRMAGKRLKVADSLGTRLSGRDLLIRILCAKRVLDRVLAPDEKRVGVLLPPTAAAVVVNAALVLLGRVAVNLN